MDNRYKRPTFESPNFLTDDIETPKVKEGGSSSSNVLNRFFDTVSRELGLLMARINAVASRSDRVVKIGVAQSAALLAQWQSLSTRVDQASGYSLVLADMHSQTYVNLAQTTADIDYDFGQATLPIRSTSDLLAMTDVYGNVRVDNEVEVSTAIGTSPTTLDYAVDPEAIYMLREEQEWILPTAASGSFVWTKIKAPLQHRGLAPNVLELWPVCSFALDLVEVSYQLAGQSFTGSWTALDLSYLPKYSTTYGKVTGHGPVRIHLPNLGLSQIRIKQQTRSDTVWGWARIKLYHREYNDQATLTVQDPYSRTVSNPLLRGKDPATLSLLSTTLSNSNATINLTTTDSSVTPVITGCIVSV
jgi:hypothetical protein